MRLRSVITPRQSVLHRFGRTKKANTTAVITPQFALSTPFD